MYNRPSVVWTFPCPAHSMSFCAGAAFAILISIFSDVFFLIQGLRLSGSPQSTLCGCKQGSSRGSPNCLSQASSPPPMNRPDVSLDLLYAAAGEVARIRMMEESAGLYHSKGGGIWSAPPRKTSPVPVGPKTPKPNLGHFSTNQAQLSYQQLQVAQVSFKSPVVIFEFSCVEFC